MTNSPPRNTVRVRGRDRLFQALSHRRRRSVLRVLRGHEGLRLPELAERVASRERDEPGGELPSEHASAVSIDLHHRHVPVLIEADLIEHGDDRNVLTLSERGTDVDAWVKALAR